MSVPRIEDNPDEKPWYHSKIMVANVVSLVATIFAMLTIAGTLEGLGVPEQWVDITRNWIIFLAGILDAATLIWRSGADRQRLTR